MCFPNGLHQVQNKGKPMQLRRKMTKKAQMMMVPDTATATNIAKPALLPQPANYMTVPSALFATIGFMLIALAGKFMAMLPINTWNPKCIQSSKFLWIRFRKKTPIHGTASLAGKEKVCRRLPTGEKELKESDPTPFGSIFFVVCICH